MPSRLNFAVNVLLFLWWTGSTNAFAFAPQSRTLYQNRISEVPWSQSQSQSSSSKWTRSYSESWKSKALISRTREDKRSSTSTSLSMYNLPPGKSDNELGDLLKLAGSLVLVVAFFVSPLGGIVLGIFNSFLLLTILLPIMGAVGISVWQYFNTMTGVCPSCGAPVRVLKSKKEGLAEPSICFNCGSILQANYDNSGIDNITGRNTIDDISNSPFGGGLFDIFASAPTSVSKTTTVIKEDKGSQKSKIRRESTIIDVEVDNDEPWQ